MRLLEIMTAAAAAVSLVEKRFKKAVVGNSYFILLNFTHAHILVQNENRLIDLIVLLCYGRINGIEN
jgi:hypothetical protein